MKGRKKIPDSIKELRGTNQPCRMSGETNINPVEDFMEISDAKGLSVLKTKRAKDIFKEKANQLIQLKVLTNMDLEQLAIYAHNVDMMFTCMTELKKYKFKEVKDKNQNTVTIENPYLKLYKDLIPLINKMASEFGFSPVSRMKFNHKPEEKDPLQALLNKFNEK